MVLGPDGQDPNDHNNYHSQMADLLRREIEAKQRQLRVFRKTFLKKFVDTKFVDTKFF